MPERPVQRYSGVFRAKEQGFVVELTFSSRLAFLLLRWWTADTVSVVLNFPFLILRYSLIAARFLLSTPSTAFQSPSASGADPGGGDWGDSPT